MHIGRGGGAAGGLGTAGSRVRLCLFLSDRFYLEYVCSSGTSIGLLCLCLCDSVLLWLCAPGVDRTSWDQNSRSPGIVRAGCSRVPVNSCNPEIFIFGIRTASWPSFVQPFCRYYLTVSGGKGKPKARDETETPRQTLTTTTTTTTTTTPTTSSTLPPPSSPPVSLLHDPFEFVSTYTPLLKESKPPPPSKATLPPALTPQNTRLL